MRAKQALDDIALIVDREVAVEVFSALDNWRHDPEEWLAVAGLVRRTLLK